MTSGSRAAERRRGGRRRTVALVLAALVLVLIGLALLALPLLKVQPEADAARQSLMAAEDALRTGDLPTAEDQVASARAHVDAASDRVHGIGGTVWRWVPVAGGAVADAQHLVDALDEATSIAEIGADLYPDVMRSDTLMQDTTVDLAQLGRILTGVDQAGTHLHAAADALAEVDGDTPFVGDRVAAARDEAQARLDPILTTYDRAAPVLGRLPDVLGADGGRTYLVAILNPAELRYSGGATLTMTTLRLEGGEATFGRTTTTEDLTEGGEFVKWPKVKGNPFHVPGKTRVTSATFSPYWSQSGEELLRAWHAIYDEDLDGVIAIDLQGLSRLMALTGPVQVEGYGELTADNLVQVLAGSYDTYDDPAERHRLNVALVPVFREKLFGDGKLAQKSEVLAEAAKGRHFAMYFRDGTVQEAFVDRGLAGDLSDTDHDYLGVATQNINGSKADYWQARTVDSDVTLAADGSAEVSLTVTVGNPSPPYVHGSEDPKLGYYTRWAGNAVAAFLPRGAEVGSATIRGMPFTPVVRSVLDRPYFYRKVLIEPGGQAVLQVSYLMPAAAVAEGDSLTYHLAIDPQPLVVPQATRVTLHVPDGYVASALPEGWTQVDAGTLRYESPGLDESPRFAVPLVRG